jgi:hypothetical protein
MQMNTVSPESASGVNLRFKDYLLENVYLRTTESQRSEILELWRSEGAGIEGEDAERSSREAVFLIRAGSGELAGVSTVALVRIKGGKRFYSFSMFLRERHRVPYLMVTVCDATRDFLRNFKHPVAQPAGMLNVNENPKLMRPGMRRIFARHGYRYWGQTTRGEDVWATEFGEPDDRLGVSPTAPGNEG